MLKNYLKIAVRNLSKHKLFSFINIFGLALSMCIGLIVIMRIQDDFSYDNFHPAPGRTYRIISEVTNQEGRDFRLASTPLPLAATLKDNYGIVENTARIYPAWNGKASSGKKSLDVSVAFTDPSFFKLFGFKLEEGDGGAALNAPNKIVLSRETATRFFGKENAVGKSLVFEKMGTFMVTGVMESSIKKSHIDFGVYSSMSSIPALERSGKLPANSVDWSNISAGYTYVMLKEGIFKKQLTAALNNVTAPFRTSGIANKSSIIFDVQSITKIAPGEDLGNSIGRGATIGKIAAESTIAFIILISACFNYTNLSIARSLKRGKEVGIRKVSGALRSQIFLQFIIESVVISFFALGLAYIMMEQLKNYTALRSEFFPEGVSMNAVLAGWFLLFSLLAGLLAGVIPAITLSTFKPVEVLKNLPNIRLFGRNGLRQALIVFQFSLSLVVIIFMLVFNKQFNYMATADYGFNRQRIINIPLQGTDYRLLKNEVASISGVTGVSATSDNLGRFASGYINVKQQPRDEGIHMSFFDVDEDFVSNMQLKIIAGTGFLPSASNEEKTVLLNEKALTALKINTAPEAVGRIILLDDSTKVQVAGVLKDFHFEGFEHPITPLVFRSREKAFNFMNVKTAMAEPDAGSLVLSLQRTWKKFNPHQDLSYNWFNRQFYETKSATGTVSMLGLLAFMGITIACLGLLGMVVYTVEGRIKEVSIRKVLGAGVASILALLSKSFLKLVLVAIGIAAPLGWICSYLFLQIFAVRVDIGFGILSFASVAILILALLVIGSQVIRVANTNPADNLHAE
ncbi:MAG: ABC transporter permease [Ferruginibacter sp.]